MSLLKRLIFAIIVLAAIACGKKDPEDTDSAPFEESKKTGGSALSMDAWCTKVPNPDGPGQLQFRLRMYDDKTFNSSLFSLNSDESRDQEFRKTAGYWDSNETEFKLIIDGIEYNYSLEHQEQARNGKPRLVLKDSNRTFIHEPCE
jgi:hypothetical protein